MVAPPRGAGGGCSPAGGGRASATKGGTVTVQVPTAEEYYNMAACAAEWDTVRTIPQPNYMIHIMVPKGTPEDSVVKYAEIWIENHSQSSRLELPKLSFVMRLGPGTFLSRAETGAEAKAFPFALLSATHKGSYNVALPEKDCLCLKRTGDACSVVDVHSYIQEVGLAASDSAVWAHARPQPQRGPRKLQGGSFNFIPAAVPLADMTADTCGQLIPTVPLKNYSVLYEMQHVGSQLSPANGSNVAVVATRKKLAIPCLRLARVGVRAP